MSLSCDLPSRAITFSPGVHRVCGGSSLTLTVSGYEDSAIPGRVADMCTFGLRSQDTVTMRACPVTSAHGRHPPFPYILFFAYWANLTAASPALPLGLLSLHPLPRGSGTRCSECHNSASSLYPHRGRGPIYGGEGGGAPWALSQ